MSIWCIALASQAPRPLPLAIGC